MMRVNLDKIKDNIENNFTLNKRLIGGLLFVSLIMIIALVIDLDFLCIEDYPAPVSNVIVKVCEFSQKICGSDNSYIMDAFALIWGMTITVLLFFLELRNSYWYGVTLKRIIILTFDKTTIAFASILYIVLCPLVYLGQLNGCYVSTLWGIMCTQAAFIALPIFLLCATRKKSIVKLLQVSTMEQFCLIHTDACDSILMGLERLPITDMIKHANYENSIDIEQLLSTLEQLSSKKGILELIQNTVYEHVVIMLWAERIIEKSGVESAHQRDRTIYIMKKFWGKLMISTEESTALAEEKRMSCSIEILLPLLKHNTREAEMAFEKILIAYDEMRYKIMIYLLLYLEFLHCDNPLEVNLLINPSLWDIICIDFMTLQRECAIWNRNLALEFWLNWKNFQDSHNDTAISYFLDFCKDVDYIAQGRMNEINTYTMRKTKARLEKS